jgi:hypothetical protein
MIVMVHDNYVSSEWALREIETFLAAGNEAAMRERLYIIAMSRPAIERLYANPRWRQLRLDDQVWLPFFGDENPAQPLPMFLKRGILAPGFLTASNRLRDDLAAKLRRAREGSAPADDGGTRPAPARPEADTRSEIAVGDRAGGPGARLSDDTMRQLQAAGLRVLRLTQIDAAVRGAPALARAQRLVLPFDNQPLEGDGGGHLEAISRAWLALGREASSIAWVDMRSPQQALEDVGAARWVIGQGLPTVALADWLRALEPGSEPGPAPIEREAQRRSVRIYIESNAREPDHWRALGDMLQQRWNRDVPEPAPVPRLAVRGLPMDALDSFPSLDDADGVILLWGRKTADALMAQVNRVENRLPPGPIIAPGLVAYLIPPHPPTAEPVPAWGWRVLRFSVEAAGRAIDIADDDARELDRFLRQALETHMRRLARDESSRPA